EWHSALDEGLFKGPEAGHQIAAEAATQPRCSRKSITVVRRSRGDDRPCSPPLTCDAAARNTSGWNLFFQRSADSPEVGSSRQASTGRRQPSRSSVAGGCGSSSDSLFPRRRPSVG